MEDSESLRRRLRDFVDTRVIPAEDALEDGARAEETRSRLRAAAKEAGLWALPLPAEPGAAGLPLADYLGLAEDEGRSDHGPEVLGSASLLNVRMLATHADPALREWILPGLVDGERHIAYAMTEPGVAGSDPHGLRTEARQGVDGGWTITGRKWFTSAAAHAEMVLVVARTETESAPRDCFSVLAVPTGATGFRIVRELDVLGVGGQYELEFDRVAVPATHLIGPRGGGLRLAGERLALGRTLRALRWVGQAQRAVERLAARLRERRLGADTLADRQLMQRLVFEAELQVRGARLLSEQAAGLVAAGQPSTVEVSMAKVAAARALSTAADSAVQAYGAEGLTAASGLPRLLRTARAARILDGAEELHISSGARRLLREYATAGNQTGRGNDLLEDTIRGSEE
ncbi:acyl-CoA dehydrogenase family protein [Amycolatopsis cihanbeyliensis]|uniref:Alkylation response protein AidB-like acyl-CoA dehydrogenase n=1 Tax=Amycolatopsis cihanbeyliensis TaxID=1128664 RepID=A0A542DEB4_AMYCI|nr:acyl-CoA dehydrogenase family protein [Amycolatopsis cihanbeyliensis]TQJ01409.1 alkylation response protein AidB-like acyl-CoA dehydrogenase [Amycolatopsis cihanbeyliensis]